MTHIAVMIPARNEEDELPATVASTRATVVAGGATCEIVVVDDGSHDGTKAVAERLGCATVVLPDRGYSALGRPELAQTHNSGFRHIAEHFERPDYLFVVGADTTFERDYVSLILRRMEVDKRLVIASGMYEGDRLATGAVRGSGRLVEYGFWERMGGIVPDRLFAWESYPVVYAGTAGFLTANFPAARMHTAREPMQRVDWECYGKAMRENGSWPPHVIARAIKQLVKGHPRHAARLIRGFVAGSSERYPPEMRRYVRKNQVLRALRCVGLGPWLVEQANDNTSTLA